MRPDHLLTRPEYMTWRTQQGDPNECLLCDKDKQIVLKEYPQWLWTMSIAPYRQLHTFIIPKRHIETIQEVLPEEFQEFQQVHAEGQGYLRRLGNKRVIMMWRQRDDRLHKKTGSPNIMHLHVHLMPDTEDMMDCIAMPDATDMATFRRLKELVNEG